MSTVKANCQMKHFSHSNYILTIQGTSESSQPDGSGWHYSMPFLPFVRTAILVAAVILTGDIDLNKHGLSFSNSLSTSRSFITSKVFSSICPSASTG